MSQTTTGNCCGLQSIGKFAPVAMILAIPLLGIAILWNSAPASEGTSDVSTLGVGVLEAPRKTSATKNRPANLRGSSDSAQLLQFWTYTDDSECTDASGAPCICGVTC